jgi:hypothetical protein
VLAVSLAPALTALGEQRALLVGVGKYSAPGIDLPAIDLDLERMRETLNLMDFQDSQIRTLLDEEATANSVIRGLETWLKQGVSSDDRVVFYFSGHGSNTPDMNGDEPDGVDEVLVMHDVRRVESDGRATLTGVISDDELASLIDAIPSRNIWIIVDACHSGTVTRAINLDNLSLGADPVYPKSFAYAGMPEGNQFVFDRDFKKGGEANFVAISAANDDEKAIGTTRGGVFTIGLTKAIREAANRGGSRTVNQLREEVATYIEEHVDESAVHTPQVTGSQNLAESALRIMPIEVRDGPNWKKLIELVRAQSNYFGLQSSKQTYAVDELVEFRVDIPIDGYLNLVSIDSADSATVLFPNKEHRDNSVPVGVLDIPTERMTFELPAAEPVGPTLVAGFVTRDPINFYNETLDDRNENGDIDAVLSTLSHTATRAIRVAPRRQEMYAVHMELTIIAKE